ncbi:MAG: tetratricopeptide repeat protein [Candidatus Scalindua sp.]|nr:tetratricopeptide repeat protein [Candidatus Scalindua sp.]
MGNDIKSLLQNALQQHMNGDFSAAAVTYHEILEEETENVDANFLMGTLCLQQGFIVDACEFLKKTLELEPDHVMAINNLGTALQKLGKLDEAIASYRHAVFLKPEYAEPYYNLGNTWKKKGQLDKAVEYYHRAIELKPHDSQSYSRIGDIYREQGKFGKAIMSYRHATELKPDDAELQCNLGAALQKTGRVDDAIRCYRRALDIKPDYFLAHSNLGSALQETGAFEEAVQRYQMARQISPDSEVIHNNLGTALKKLGKFSEAEESYRKAIALKPDYAEAYNNLGTVFLEQRKLQEAVSSYNLALELKPDFAMAYSNLGMVLRELGKFDDAIDSCKKALGIDPDCPESYNNLGASLQAANRLEEAIACYKQATSLNPDYALAHMNMSLALLLAGNFDDGWQEYEWRLRIRNHIPATLKKHMWDGSSLNGKSILIHTEQGFGDTIQFARYLPMVQVLGGKVILECQNELICLLRDFSGIDEFLEYTPTCKPAIPFDVHLSLLSLPRIFGTTLDTVPADIPYIKVDSQLVKKWSKRVGNNDNFKIGIVWAGSSKNINNMNRSCSLADFAILAEIPGITFYTLQKGPASGEAANSPEGMEIINLEKELEDFADTAAVIANLDLVISVDTAVVHLAGAMGKPVWNLLTFAPSWRWLQKRDDSPWYPTMRLFRQSHPHVWTHIFQQVKEKLFDIL